MPTAVDSQWWTASFEGKRHEGVTRVVRSIRQAQEYRKATDLIHASLYANRPVTGFGIGSSRANSEQQPHMALNVVRNMTGAVASKIAAKNKPKPTFLPDGGSYEERELAERREKFVGGVFYETKLYSLLTRCFRDACVWGTGFLKVYADGKKVGIDRVRSVEMVVDDMEAIDGNPPNIYQRKYVDRLVLKHLWAKGDDEAAQELTKRIDACVGNSDDVEYAYQTSADQVLVTEAWHIGEGDDVKGRHCITIDGADLLDEEWDGPHPFAVFRWSEDIEGFFGVGLAEELRGIQDEINTLLQQIQAGHYLITGQWCVEHGSKVATEHINNDLRRILRFTGTKPTYEVPSIIAPEVYQHLWALYEKAYEIVGISQLNATGQKPPGLDAAVAMRAYQDIQTERFLEVGQNYEEFVMDCARLVLRVARKLPGKYRVRAPDKRSYEYVDCGDLGDDADDAVIQVFPTSMLPSTPAGRTQWALDMIDRKALPAEDALDIVNFPDTEAYTRRQNAARKVIERNVAHMLKTGEFVSPEPMDDHKMALRLVNQEYHAARLDEVPEAKLELLRRYMADTSDFLSPPPAPNPMGAAPPPPPPGAPPMGAPPPMPMPPPTGAPMGQAA